MSADRWTICPKCEIEETRAAKEFSKKVEDSYGKVPAEEYLEMKMKEQDIEPILEATLREDYEIGVREGALEVSYTCSCNVCRFSFEHRYQQQLP